ncbi:MAG: hypothetical protein HN919_16585 [Verrucomicrobia bacterium]|jgi:hypothetical protein|nr:hypothetical protein [Verrucomicrobiota bacterium]MBT7701604.1 hypothetical protein [Verrucomicrobiota bacterium]
MMLTGRKTEDVQGAHSHLSLAHLLNTTIVQTPEQFMAQSGSPNGIFAILSRWRHPMSSTSPIKQFV